MAGRAMMDLGLGSIIDKFEEYFGRRVTRLLLILIGLAVVAGCVSVIWSWLIAPLLAFLSTPLWGRTVANLVFTVFAIGGGVAISFNLSSSWLQLRRLRESKRLLTSAEDVFERGSAQNDRHFADAREMIKQADDLFEETLEMYVAVAEANPHLTGEERASLIEKAKAARVRTAERRGASPASPPVYASPASPPAT